MAMKYLILTIGDREKPFLFPETVGHVEMARVADRREAVSAGFVKLDGRKIVCFGRSEELDIESRGYDDSLLICYYLASKQASVED
jgi:hypothetical protein